MDAIAFKMQRFAPVNVTTDVTVEFRNTGSEKKTKKIPYVNPLATDQQISDCVKALNLLSTNTYITCRKTSEYDVEASIADDEENP